MLFPGEFSCKPRSYRYISSAARKNNTSIMTSLRVIYGVVERSFPWMYQYRKWTTSIEWIFLLFLFDELFLADILTGSESIREFLMPVSANLGYMTWWNDLVRSCVPCNFFMWQNDNICRGSVSDLHSLFTDPDPGQNLKPDPGSWSWDVT